MPIVTRFLWGVKHWEYTREHPCSIPVEHVAGVCTYLVESASEQIVELYRPGAAPAVKPHLARLYHFARWVEQLNIEHPAHVREPLPVTSHHICAEPQCLATEICRVVKVQVDFLLREQSVEGLNVIDEALQSAHCRRAHINSHVTRPYGLRVLQVRQPLLCLCTLHYLCPFPKGGVIAYPVYLPSQVCGRVGFLLAGQCHFSHVIH